MSKNEFLKSLEEQLEVAPGTLREDLRLADVQAWDSMAAVLFIALADEKMGLSISGNQIAAAKTFGDLLALLGTKLST